MERFGEDPLKRHVKLLGQDNSEPRVDHDNTGDHKRSTILLNSTKLPTHRFSYLLSGDTASEILHDPSTPKEAERPDAFVSISHSTMAPSHSSSWLIERAVMPTISTHFEPSDIQKEQVHPRLNLIPPKARRPQSKHVTRSTLFLLKSHSLSRLYGHSCHFHSI